MAKVTGPLFSMSASGTFGMIVFDRRGFARIRTSRRDAKSASQGNFRQAMQVAQQCAKVCGPATRHLLRGVAAEPSRWSAYLAKQIIGPQRSTYEACLQHYAGDVTDPNAWETAALSIGLREVAVAYADTDSVSPGAQLFILASALFALDLYPGLGQPGENAEMWRGSITL